MVKHTKVTPDPKSENVDDTEPVKDNSCEVGLDWNAVKVKSKPKVISSSSHASSVDIQSMKMAAYVKKRQDMKDRVVREVFAAALPDTEEFDLDDCVLTVEPLSAQSAWKKWLKFFGILPLTLHEAVLSGSVAHVKAAILKFQKGKRAQPALVDAYDENGQTALLLAVKVGRRDMVDELLYTGNARVDYADIRDGMTPLLYAIRGKHIDIVRLLIREGASLFMCDFTCMTPLMMAASTGEVSLLKAIAGEYIASVDDQDEHGWTALHWAVYANSRNAILYLLDVLVADRDIKCNERKKPYHLAVFLKHGECEAVLMDNKMKMAVATLDHLN